MQLKQGSKQNYPFATIDPNVGVVEVPDLQFTKLTELVVQRKLSQRHLSFHRYCGYRYKGQAAGKVLEINSRYIRQVDAICQGFVVLKRKYYTRGWESRSNRRHRNDQSRISVTGPESVDKRIARVKIAKTKDKDAGLQNGRLRKNQTCVRRGVLARNGWIHRWRINRERFIPLTTKLMLYIKHRMWWKAGIPICAISRRLCCKEDAEVVVICAKSKKSSRIRGRRKTSLLRRMGIEISGLDILTKAYHLLVKRRRKRTKTLCLVVT